jgi:acyl carrier protein
MMDMIKSLLEENGYPTEDLTEETTFESLGVDSLGLVDLTLSLEQKGYSIPEEKLSEIKTVGDLIRVLGGNA